MSPAAAIRLGAFALVLGAGASAVHAQAAPPGDSARAQVLHERGIRLLGEARYDSAIVAFTEAIVLRSALGDSLGFARSTNSLGTVHFQLGQYELALDHFLRSLAIRRVLADTAGMARVLTNLGATYQDLQQFGRARATMQEALALAEASGTPGVLGYALGVLGSLESETGDQAEAERVLTRALDVYRPSRDPRVLAPDSVAGWRFTARPLGLMHVRAGHADVGLPMLQQLVQAEVDTQSVRGEAWARVTLGEAYASLGRLEEARTEFSRALRLSRGASLKPLTLEALRHLADAEARAGRPAESLANLQAYLALRDTLFSEAAVQRLAAIESQMEVDRLGRASREQAARLARQRVVSFLGALVLLLAGIALAQLVRYNRLGRARETELARANAELRTALADVRTLSGLIPICASCKSVRDDRGYWEAVETYVGDRSHAMFSHSICPDCGPKLYGAEWHPQTGEAPRP